MLRTIVARQPFWAVKYYAGVVDNKEDTLKIALKSKLIFSHILLGFGFEVDTLPYFS